MSEWKEVILFDIIDLIGGGTPKTSVSDYWNGNIPWLSVADFNNGRKYVFDTEKSITVEGLNNSSVNILNEGDIIISARGTVGLVAVLGKRMTFNQSCYGIRAKQIYTTNDYVYYLIKDTVSNFLQIAHGGVFDTITIDTFKEISITLPPLPIQSAITDVLSSLDNKIDLLHRQNATLEKLAETIFRQMFVEETKKEWKEVTLYDAIKLVGGGTPNTKISDYWDGNIKWLSGGDIAKSHKRFVINSEKSITELGIKNSSAKLLPKFSTVISARGTVGKFCILSKPMAFSQSNYGVLPKFKDCYFFTYLLVAQFVDELQSTAYGSVFDTITTSTFKGISIKIPSKDEILDFEKKIRPYFYKIESNQIQISTLTNLCDTLLPKLISGEVRLR